MILLGMWRLFLETLMKCLKHSLLKIVSSWLQLTSCTQTLLFRLTGFKGLLKRLDSFQVILAGFFFCTQKIIIIGRNYKGFHCACCLHMFTQPLKNLVSTLEHLQYVYIYVVMMLKILQKYSDIFQQHILLLRTHTLCVSILSSCQCGVELR